MCFTPTIIQRIRLNQVQRWAESLLSMSFYDSPTWCWEFGLQSTMVCSHDRFSYLKIHRRSGTKCSDRNRIKMSAIHRKPHTLSRPSCRASFPAQVKARFKAELDHTLRRIYFHPQITHFAPKLGTNITHTINVMIFAPKPVFALVLVIIHTTHPQHWPNTLATTIGYH